jgi:hypothetical protein
MLISTGAGTFRLDTYGTPSSLGDPGTPPPVPVRRPAAGSFVRTAEDRQVGRPVGISIAFQVVKTQATRALHRNPRINKRFCPTVFGAARGWSIV